MRTIDSDWQISQDNTDVLVEKTKIKTLKVVGRRWFNKRVGSTYHSADIFVNGEQVEGVSFRYGYDGQYMCSAFTKLEQLGIITDRIQEEGSSPESLWRWAERHGVVLDYSATNVPRKKDL